MSIFLEQDQDRTKKDMAIASLVSESSEDLPFQSPLSLDERRLRNKTASAKYRARKNHQYAEMQHIVHHLSQQNSVLQRELDNSRREVAFYKFQYDQLWKKLARDPVQDRGFLKMVAEQSSCFSNGSMDVNLYFTLKNVDINKEM
ncbi:hypothetical protein DFQ28_006337 [Apophysomyces sp. BC1034]|nr:hypothetical protein DFQ29_008868 [Apophysomyces sp. BC1021]KAG0193114.1 hypothetical protein DFQ28_006337 [Apophysomyces sp. BC1034]